MINPISKPQIYLREFLNKLLNVNCLYNTRSIISPYELDIYFNEFNLAFEYNGKRWHEKEDVKERDILKNNLCKERGIVLITIIESSRNYIDDIKYQLIKNLDIINLVTNKQLIFDDILNLNIDISSNIMNLDLIKNICDQYTIFSEFKKENKNICDFLYRNKLISKFTDHMFKRRYLSVNK